MTPSLGIVVGGVLCAFAWNVWQGYHDPRPIAPPESPSGGLDVVGVVAGTLGLAGLLVTALVWLSPLLILAWLVTR